MTNKMKKIVTTQTFDLEDFAQDTNFKSMPNIIDFCHAIAGQLTLAIKEWDERLAVTFQNRLHRATNPRGVMGHFQVEQEFETKPESKPSL